MSYATPCCAVAAHPMVSTRPELIALPTPNANPIASSDPKSKTSLSAARGPHVRRGIERHDSCCRVGLRCAEAHERRGSREQSAACSTLRVAGTEHRSGDAHRDAANATDMVKIAGMPEYLRPSRSMSTPLNGERRRSARELSPTCAKAIEDRRKPDTSATPSPSTPGPCPCHAPSRADGLDGP